MVPRVAIGDKAFAKRSGERGGVLLPGGAGVGIGSGGREVHKLNSGFGGKLQTQKSPQGLRLAGFQDFVSGSGDRQQRILVGWRELNLLFITLIMYHINDFIFSLWA